MNIPFVVIVQPHLLKDKGSVRLRRVLQDDMEIGWNTGSGSAGGNEQFVALQNLASTIRDMSETLGADAERTMMEESHNENIAATRNSASEAVSFRSAAGRVDCVYIDEDQYFSEDMKVSKNDTPHYKNIIKSIKGTIQRSEAYLSSQLDSTSPVPVFGVADIPFWVLREFGTSLMRRERKERTAIGASIETIEKYPKGKRSLKTLAMAIDNFMKKCGLWDQNISGYHAKTVGSRLLTILLYSKQDDRFDMVSLEGVSHNMNVQTLSKKK